MNQQDIIRQHIKYGKIAHVYFLAGPSEWVSGKERFVEEIASLLNVPPANRVMIGKNEDVITIDMMRDLKTMMASSSGNVPRVAMIYHADCFTAQAANAFLKTLEEPPSYTIFFLLASSRAGILPTILSRVWTVRFSRPTSNVAPPTFNVSRPTSNVAPPTFNVSRPTLNVGGAETFFKKPFAERYAINEQIAKSDDHGKQFLADLITHLRYETKNGIKNAADTLPHAVEAYELLHLPGAPYRLILDTLASYDASR